MYWFAVSAATIDAGVVPGRLGTGETRFGGVAAGAVAAEDVELPARLQAGAARVCQRQREIGPAAGGVGGRVDARQQRRLGADAGGARFGDARAGTGDRRADAFRRGDQSRHHRVVELRPPLVEVDQPAAVRQRRLPCRSDREGRVGLDRRAGAADQCDGRGGGQDGSAIHGGRSLRCRTNPTGALADRARRATRALPLSAFGRCPGAL